MVLGQHPGGVDDDAKLRDLQAEERGDHGSQRDDGEPPPNDGLGIDSHPGAFIRGVITGRGPPAPSPTGRGAQARANARRVVTASRAASVRERFKRTLAAIAGSRSTNRRRKSPDSTISWHGVRATTEAMRG